MEVKTVVRKNYSDNRNDKFCLVTCFDCWPALFTRDVVSYRARGLLCAVHGVAMKIRD
jgi:hypothetical protein